MLAQIKQSCMAICFTTLCAGAMATTTGAPEAAADCENVPGTKADLNSCAFQEVKLQYVSVSTSRLAWSL